MPRFDPYYAEIQIEFDLEYDPEDPGATDPVDLCMDCAAAFDEEMTCDHPPYEELDYRCRICGKPLTEEDDDWR